MIYLKEFDSHSSYESELNVGGVDFKIPNVSYCKDVKDVHFNPYNLIKFYVGEISGTTPQTVKIYTDKTTSVDVTVSEGNKWYSYVLPKNKGLYKIEGGSVKKVVIKADINIKSDTIIPTSTVEASFKGSNTSNVTDMSIMFYGCSGLTSLDVSNFDTSNVTDMSYMFDNCSSLESLDLRNFNTSKVNNMSLMFTNCRSLTSLDLSNFDTSKVTDMSSVFSGCVSLTYLDLSGWNTSNVTSMQNIFYGSTSLKTIRMVGCSEDTIGRINLVKPSSATIVTGQTI